MLSVINCILEYMQEITDRSYAEVIADAVRAELARAHRSMADLASVLHVSRATIYRRFDSTEPFDVTELEKIAGFLGINVQDIFDSAEFGQRLLAKAAA